MNWFGMDLNELLMIWHGFELICYDLALVLIHVCWCGMDFNCRDAKDEEKIDPSERRTLPGYKEDRENVDPSGSRMSIPPEE